MIPMPDFGSITDIGLAGLALLALLAVIDYARKRYRESEPGERRKEGISPRIIGCPNKIHELPQLLIALTETAKEQARIGSLQLELLNHNRDGIDRLVEQHRPTPDGRETWKIPARMEQLQEESRDSLREIVSLLKKNGNGR